MIIKTDVYWEGRLPLGNVNWKLVSKVQPFPAKLEKKRIELWNEMSSKYPSFYDGTLLTYAGHEIGENGIMITLGLMQFSQLLVVSRFNNKKWTNQLGIALAIYNRDKTRILIGKRPANSYSHPLHYMLPGGMLELKDLDIGLEAACLRELKEEIFLDFTGVEMHLLAIIENSDRIGKQLIVEVTTELEGETTIEGNEEWDGRLLHWIDSNGTEKRTVEPSLSCLNYALSRSE